MLDLVESRPPGLVALEEGPHQVLARFVQHGDGEAAVGPDRAQVLAVVGDRHRHGGGHEANLHHERADEAEGLAVPLGGDDVQSGGDAPEGLGEG